MPCWIFSWTRCSVHNASSTEECPLSRSILRCNSIFFFDRSRSYSLPGEENGEEVKNKKPYEFEIVCVSKYLQVALDEPLQAEFHGQSIWMGVQHGRVHNEGMHHFQRMQIVLQAVPRQHRPRLQKLQQPVSESLEVEFILPLVVVVLEYKPFNTVFHRRPPLLS